MKHLWIATLFVSLTASGATIAEKTAGTTKLDGYFPMYWDAEGGKLYLEIPHLNTDFLYVTSLPSGLGQNDVGLDRGEIRGSRIVRFQRVGPKVMLVEPNFAFRATSNDANVRKSVEQSFPQSVLWGFKVEAETGSSVLVDATDFYVRDGAGVIEKLDEAKQGTYQVDAMRSAVYLPATKNFVKNSEVEVSVTLTSPHPGPLIGQVAPEPQALTLREHHSFIELPGPGYTPRAYDPRAGYFDVNFYDFGTRFSAPVVQRVLPRHRLAAGGTLQYYVDPGIPEPLRSAVLEGARWWTQAFAAAGHPNAFKVDLLPEGADPMDVRYNMVNWVNRSTRGWSFGETITDPRTGEIIKGQVTLGSLRPRQDYMIAEGLLAPYESGTEPSAEAEQMVLARIRQLAAHEVGHTLGLSHNYAASAHNRASVMDYPHPLVEMGANGVPTLGNAYATGIGDWDKVSIAYGYTVFPAGHESAPGRAGRYPPQVDRRRAGVSFRRRRPARGQRLANRTLVGQRGERGGRTAASDGCPPPRAGSFWRTQYSRRRSIQHARRCPGPDLSAASLPDRSGFEAGCWSRLSFRSARRRSEAGRDGSGGRTAPRHGGSAFDDQARSAGTSRTASSTDRPSGPRIHTRQRGLRPSHRPDIRSPGRGGVGGEPDPTHDSESRTSQPSGGAARPGQARIPGLAEVIRQIKLTTWEAPPEQGMRGEIRRVADSVMLFHLMALAKDESASTQARAIAGRELDDLRKWLLAPRTGDASSTAHWSSAAAQIKRYQDNPKEFEMPAPAEPPPGQPMGEE